MTGPDPYMTRKQIASDLLSSHIWVNQVFGLICCMYDMIFLKTFEDRLTVLVAVLIVLCKVKLTILVCY